MSTLAVGTDASDNDDVPLDEVLDYPSDNGTDSDSDGEHVTEYGKAEYWDERYTNFSPFDWLFEYTHFKDAGFSKFFRKSDRFIMLGCGSAMFSTEMYDDGYEHIANVDLSSVVIQDEREKNAGRDNMTYEVMDVQELRYEDETFDVAIDKSTMDCIFCCSNSVTMISNMMHEAWRVLKPGGLFMTFSLHDAEKVLPYMGVDENGLDFNWVSVKCMKIPNPGWTKGSDKSKTHLIVSAVKPATPGIGPTNSSNTMVEQQQPIVLSEEEGGEEETTAPPRVTQQKSVK